MKLTEQAEGVTNVILLYTGMLKKRDVLLLFGAVAG
jgi:hypothetical protein